MFKFVLFASLAYFAIDCHVILYNGKLYPGNLGSKIFFDLREPPEGFNPPIIAGFDIWTTTRPASTNAISTSQTFDITTALKTTETTTRTAKTTKSTEATETTEFRSSPQPLTTDWSKTAKTIETEISLHPFTTDWSKTIEFESSSQPSTTKGCSSCDGNCILRQYRCASDSDCPACYKCFSDDFHIYKICKHVNRDRTTTVATDEAYVDYDSEVEIIDTTLNTNNQKREDEDFISTLAASSSSATLHVTATPSLESTRQREITTWLFSKISTPEITRAVASTISVSDNNTSFSDTTTHKIESTVANITSTTESVSPNTVSESSIPTIKNVTIVVPTNFTSDSASSDMPTTTGEPNLQNTTFSSEVTTFTPLNKTARSTSESTVSTVQTTAGVSTTTVNENVTTTFFSASKITTDKLNTTLSSTITTASITANVENTTCVTENSNRVSAENEIFKHVINTVAAVITGLVPKIFDSPCISNNNNMTEPLSNRTTVEISNNTFQTKLLSTSTTQALSNTTIEVTTQEITSSTTLRNAITAENIPTTSKPRFTPAESTGTTTENIPTTSKPRFTPAESTGTTTENIPTTSKPRFTATESGTTLVNATTPGEIESGPQVTSSNTKFDTQTPNTKQKTTTTLSSEIDTTGEVTTSISNTNSESTVPRTITNIPIFSTMTKAGQENKTTVDAPIDSTVFERTVETTFSAIEVVNTTLTGAPDIIKTTTVPTTIVNESTIFSTNYLSTVVDIATNTTIPSVNVSGSAQVKNNQTTVHVVVSTIPTTLPISIYATESTIVSASLRNGEQDVTTVNKIVPDASTTVSTIQNTAKIENNTNINKTVPDASTTVSTIQNTDKIENNTNIVSIISVAPTLKTNSTQSVTVISNEPTILNKTTISTTSSTIRKIIGKATPTEFVTRKTTTLNPTTISAPSNATSTSRNDITQNPTVSFSTPNAVILDTILTHRTTKKNVEPINEVTSSVDGEEDDIYSGSGERISESEDDEDYNDPQTAETRKKALHLLVEETEDNGLTIEEFLT